jgi:hypothetical protein
MPERPEPEKTIINKYIKEKVPHFFIYAKDKEKDRVSELNDSVVNRLETVVPNKPIRFQKIAGKLNYKMLMKNKSIQLDEDIINKYEQLDKSKKWKINFSENAEANETLYLYQYIRDQILEINNDIDFVVDVLVKYLHKKNKSRKETLWKSFGDVLLENLFNNIANTKQCENCGVRIETTSNRSKFCDSCWKQQEKILRKEINRKYYESKKFKTV